MFLLILGLLMFVGLVVIHEWGHFVMARRHGVEVEEFGIGFPPKFYKKRIKSPKGDYNFTLNVLPLGGFVKLKGEHDTDSAPGSYGAAGLWAKTQIMAAGVVMNLITAFVLLTLLALIGIPKLIDNQFTIASDTKVVKSEVLIGDTEDGSPAAKAGIKSGDRILGAINSNNLKQACPGIDSQIVVGGSVPCGNPKPDTDFNTAKDLTGFTKSHAGQSVYLVVAREGSESVYSVKIRSAAEVKASENTKKPKGYIGVYPTDYTIQRSTWSAPVVGAGLIGQFTALTYQGIGKALAGLGKLIGGIFTNNATAREEGKKQASEQVSGPLGIFFILKQGTLLGLQFILLIIAIISLTLALMNILPIPALDGGRLWLTLITRGIMGKPLTARTEEIVNATGFMALMGLIVLITIVDIRRFF